MVKLLLVAEFPHLNNVALAQHAFDTMRDTVRICDNFNIILTQATPSEARMFAELTDSSPTRSAFATALVMPSETDSNG